MQFQVTHLRSQMEAPTLQNAIAIWLEYDLCQSHLSQAWSLQEVARDASKRPSLPRSGHASATLPGGQVLVFGG